MYYRRVWTTKHLTSLDEEEEFKRKTYLGHWTSRLFKLCNEESKRNQNRT